MRYLGGKARLRDQIVPLINELDSNIYIEPFCGACWVGEKVTKPFRLFSDANPYLIRMWQRLQEGWIPPSTAPTEEEYYHIRDDDNVPLELKGYIGIAQSWGGKFWGGYARGTKSNGELRDYTSNCYNQTMKRLSNLSAAHFRCDTYSRVFARSLKATSTMIMYLDPPYENTTGYYTLPPIDSQLLYANTRVVAKKHYILISGYTAPPDFVEIRNFGVRWQCTSSGQSERLFGVGKVLDDYDFT